MGTRASGSEQNLKAERCMRRLWFVGDRVFAGKGAKKRARRWARKGKR